MCLGRSPDRRRHSVPAVLVCGNRFRLGHDPLPVGQWAQATQPFKNAAGQAVMNRGHAKITVQTGSDLRFRLGDRQNHQRSDGHFHAAVSGTEGCASAGAETARSRAQHHVDDRRRALEHHIRGVSTIAGAFTVAARS